MNKVIKTHAKPLTLYDFLHFVEAEKKWPTNIFVTIDQTDYRGEQEFWIKKLEKNIFGIEEEYEKYLFDLVESYAPDADGDSNEYLSIRVNLKPCLTMNENIQRIGFYGFNYQYVNKKEN